MSRSCENGVWSEIDFSGCLLPDGTPPFVLTWFSLDLPQHNISSQLLINEVL